MMLQGVISHEGSLTPRSEPDAAVLSAIKETIPIYPFDDYRHYPSTNPNGWQEYLFERVAGSLGSAGHFDSCDVRDRLIYLVGGRISQWDTEHFGFGMAHFDRVLYPDVPDASRTLRRRLDEAISFLREIGVRFASINVSGQDLQLIHMLEDCGFRYYQTTIYPILELSTPPQLDRDVRLWTENDLPALVEIAMRSQFSQGHYYADPGFDKKKVEMMYGKWVRTSWANQEPIAVIERDGSIAGYFAFVMDEALSRATKYIYGRMTSLAIDASCRGQGVGASLFGSVIGMIGAMGGGYVASEYSVKNHASASLHSRSRFRNVHEKVLFHLWL